MRTIVLGYFYHKIDKWVVSVYVVCWDVVTGLHFPIFPCQRSDKDSLNVVDTHMIYFGSFEIL